MSGTTNTYRVIFRYEKNGQKVNQLGERIQAHVSASANDPATIGTVLANNGYGAPSGSVIVIESIANWGAGTALA
jgi:hypothetical protein